jgi:hypothetical protein
MSYWNPRFGNGVMDALLGNNAAWNQLVMNSALTPVADLHAANAAAIAAGGGAWNNWNDPNAITPMSMLGTEEPSTVGGATGSNEPWHTPTSDPPEYPEPELPAGPGGDIPGVDTTPTTTTPTFPNINLPDIPAFDFNFGQTPNLSMPETDFSLTGPSMGNFGFVDVNSHAAGAGKPMEIPSGSLLPVEIMKSVDRKHPLEAALS